LIREAEKKFIEYLSQQDLKYTDQRKTILLEAYRYNGHFTAEAMMELTKKHDASISKATLYRTLALLTESKLLDEHDFGDGRCTSGLADLNIQ